MSIKAANNVFPHDPDDNWKQKLDRGGYEGTAKDLDDKINGIKNPDGILIAGSISKLGNVISIGEMTFKCRIDNNVLTNLQDFSTTIVNATENYKRIDILVFTKFSTIVKIQGDEELESAKEPDVPPGTIKLAFISVFGSEIIDPSQPIVIPDISEKLDKGGFEGTAQDIINSIPDPVDISLKLDKGGYNGTAADFLTKNTDQDISSIKVFLAGKLGLRNIANTFTSFFSNSNTAARTYTLQDRNGTLLDNIKIVLAPIDGDLLDFGTYLENTFTLKRVFASGERNLDFESMSTYGITSVNRFRFRLKNYTDSAVYNALMIETTTIDAVAKVTVGGDLVVTGNIQGTLSPAKINFAPIDGDLLNFGTYVENTFTLKRVFASGERNIDFESKSTYGTESVNRFRFRLKNFTDSAIYNALMIETTTTDAVAKVTVGGDLIINRNLSIIGNLSPSKIALVPNDINILNAGVNNEQLFDLKRSFSGSNRNLDFELSSSYGVTSTTRYRFRIKNYNDSALFNALEIETTNVDGAALVKVTGTLKSSKHDLSALGLYADDSAAAAGGVAIGFGYINSSTGAMHRRLT